MKTIGCRHSFALSAEIVSLGSFTPFQLILPLFLVVYGPGSALLQRVSLYSGFGEGQRGRGLWAALSLYLHCSQSKRIIFSFIVHSSNLMNGLKLTLLGSHVHLLIQSLRLRGPEFCYQSTEVACPLLKQRNMRTILSGHSINKGARLTKNSKCK